MKNKVIKTLDVCIMFMLSLVLCLALVACNSGKTSDSGNGEEKSDFERICEYIAENGTPNDENIPVLSHSESDGYTMSIYAEDDEICFDYESESTDILFSMQSMDESPVYFTVYLNRYGMAHCEIIPARFTGANEDFEFYGYTPQSCEKNFNSSLNYWKAPVLIMMSYANKLLAGSGYDMSDFGFRNFDK